MVDEEEALCEFCGIYVRGKSCPMCGSPTISLSNIQDIEDDLDLIDAGDSDEENEKGKYDKKALKRALKGQIDEDLDPDAIDLIEEIGGDSWEEEEALPQAA